MVCFWQMKVTEKFPEKKTGIYDLTEIPMKYKIFINRTVRSKYHTKEN